MRRLIVAILVVAALWSGWWVVASRMALAAVRQAVADLGQQDVRVSLAKVGVAGFPNRLDVVLRDLAVVHADTGLALRAPEVDAYTLTWNPWHVLFALPQGVALDGGNGSPLTLVPKQFLASVQVPPFGDLLLDRAQAQADGLVVARGGVQGAVGHVFAATRQHGDARSHDLWVEVKDISLPAAWPVAQGAADDGRGLGARIAAAHLDATLDFAAPVTLGSGAAPELLALTLREAVLDWGPLHATARGTLSPDADGFAEGTVDLGLTGWQALPPALQAAGLILPDAADRLGRGLGGVADANGVAHLTLTLSGGMVRFGFIPLGPAPRMAP